MEPSDDSTRLTERLLASYPRSFGAPAGSRARVWQALAVDRPRRARDVRLWVALVAGPMALAAALGVLHCTRAASLVASPGQRPDAAAYDQNHPPSGEPTSVRERDGRTAPQARVEIASAVASTQTPAPQPRRPTNAQPVGLASREDAAAAPRRESRPRRSKRRTPPPLTEIPSESVAPQIATLVRELEAVDRALRSGRASEALARIHDARSAFAAAGLSEERDGYEILARCMLGQTTEVEALRTEFTRRYPVSLYARRIAQTCEGTRGFEKSADAP